MARDTASPQPIWPALVAMLVRAIPVLGFGIWLGAAGRDPYWVDHANAISGLLALGIVWWATRREPTRGQPRWRCSVRDLGWGLLTGLGVLILVVLAWYGLGTLLPQPVPDPKMGSSTPGFLATVLLQPLWIALADALVLFGYAWPRLKARLGTPWAAAIIATTMATLKMGFTPTVTNILIFQAVLGVLVALPLLYVTDRTKQPWAAFVALAMVAFAQDWFRVLLAFVALDQSGGLFVMFFVFLVALFVVVFRGMHRR